MGSDRTSTGSPARLSAEMPGSHGLTPITLEVVRHAIYAIAEEMSLIIMRSARSPLLKEAGTSRARSPTPAAG